MKFFNSIKRHPLIAIFILTTLIAAGIILFIEFSGSLEETVQSNQAQSQTHVTEADTSERQARDNETTRGIEDGVRTEVITPKLDQARRKSNQSKQTHDAARRKYNNEKTNTSNLSNSHTDNCRDLGELFPGVRFDDCPEPN